MPKKREIVSDSAVNVWVTVGSQGVSLEEIAQFIEEEIAEKQRYAMHISLTSHPPRIEAQFRQQAEEKNT
jgi:hypothetical protein